MAEEQKVLYTAEGRIAYLTLNRLESLNAISPQMRDDLIRALDLFEGDDAVRVGILRGAGRAFCAGFDLGGYQTAGFRPQDITTWGDRERLRIFIKLLMRIWECRKPIIAQVHGYCLAGGVSFPLVADVTIISDECRVGWPKLPMGGGFIGPLFARAVGPGRAKMMELVSGSEISGRTAAQWGFAAESVPAAELEARVKGMALEMAKMTPSMLHLKKEAINRVFDNAGMQQTLIASTEWDALSHEDPGVATVRGWVREDGMKAAIARYQKDGL